MHYHYPLIIEFIDNLSSLIIILFVPLLAGGLGLLLYMTALSKEFFASTEYDSQEKGAQSIIYWSMIGVLSLIFFTYCYYSFVKLDYFSQFEGAMLGILKSIIYLMLSPFIFMQSVYTTDNIEKDLFVNGGVLLTDVKSWLVYKFGLNIDTITKSTVLVMIKLITLALFSTKIINVTNFLLYNMFDFSKKIAFIGALLSFVTLITFYAQSHQEELLNIFKTMQDIFTAYTTGAMK